MTQPQIKSPLHFFFKLGDWVSGGDPKRQQDFIYYMLWILFIAFFTMFVSNAIGFFRTYSIDNLIWALIGFAITSLQYFNLKSMWAMKQMQKNVSVTSEEDVGSVNDMLKGFDKMKGGK